MPNFTVNTAKFVFGAIKLKTSYFFRVMVRVRVRVWFGEITLKKANFLVNTAKFPFRAIKLKPPYFSN